MKRLLPSPLALSIGLAFSSSVALPALAQNASTLADVVVTAGKYRELPQASGLGARQLQPLRAGNADSASLLRDLPGVALQAGGGVSSLPMVNGLGDDRLRIQVDGMDLISACANHMNPPLSYIDPSNVGEIKLYSGVSPVSVGGDSLGSAIVVKSPTPRFAAPGTGLLTEGELGAYYRSNGDAHGINASATLANEQWSLRYSGATAESANYRAARAFKPDVDAPLTRSGVRHIPGDVVGSSSYRTENHQLAVAHRHDNHLVDFKLGYQFIPYQGFPNQHMDMTENVSAQFNLGYTGQFAWGKLEARAYNERTRHKMDFLDDKLYWYGNPATDRALIPGMPMETEGKNTGVRVKAEIPLNARDLVRVGGEYQQYRLSDWWPASFGIKADGTPSGGMQPNAFQNINDGRRDRADLFGEWEANWTPAWQTLLGLRASRVSMDTGTVQGYNTGYATDAGRFNAADRSRTDNNIDVSAMARYVANAQQTYEGGYSRKTRSPSLYERYTWSSGGMAMTMNNWVNDGNGYVGNLDLKPEVAHTLSFTADWHDAARSAWGVRLTPYYSLVENYIDASCKTSVRACVPGQYNFLTLVNQDARLYGFDLSGFAALGQVVGLGNFALRGSMSYVNGKNRDTGDHLYNMMPLNARLALEQKSGSWTNTLESVLVSAKDDVSRVRGEVKTPGYGLLNLRSSYEWKNVRVDFGIENLLDKFYYHPLSGAYIGQGRTMSLGTTANTWAGTSQPPAGYAIPGMGRSFYLGMNVKF